MARSPRKTTRTTTAIPTGVAAPKERKDPNVPRENKLPDAWEPQKRYLVKLTHPVRLGKTFIAYPNRGRVELSGAVAETHAEKIESAEEQ